MQVLSFGIAEVPYCKSPVLYGDFLWFPFSSISIEAYISAMMFILFLVFAASRKWTRKEIELIIIVIVIACDVQAVLTLISNSNLLHSNGSSHLSFLGTQVNRNPVAFAIVPGTLCGAFAFLYSNGTKGNVNKAFFLLSIVLCFFVVLQLAAEVHFSHRLLELHVLHGKSERWSDTKRKGSPKGICDIASDYCDNRSDVCCQRYIQLSTV